MINELAYVVIGAIEPESWRTFAAETLGAMATQTSEAVYIRIDELMYRILVVHDNEDRLISSGWAVRSEAEYQESRRALSATGHELTEGDSKECQLRGVGGFFTLSDPAGNRHEVCWGRSQVAHPFVSPLGIPHFVTGEMGFGHVVLPGTGAFGETKAFFTDAFDFAESDFFTMRREGMPDTRVTFMHPANARQHSLAVADAKLSGGLSHLMLEVPTLDDVGRVMDRAAAQGLMRRALGRHVNDSMVSFYIQTPAPFLIEYGYDGKQMSWEGHDVRQMAQGSYWGHQWL